MAAQSVVALVAVAAAEVARQPVPLAVAAVVEVVVVAAVAVIPAVDHRMLRTTWFIPFRFLDSDDKSLK